MKLNISFCKKNRLANRNLSALALPAPVSKPVLQPATQEVESLPATLGRAVQPHEHITQQNIVGEEKQLALMFLDIRNFTPFMEQQSPYDVVFVIRKLFALFNDSIQEAGGRIVETQGDSIYAVFGLNTGIKNAAQGALDAARSIFHDLQVFNAGYAQPYFNMPFEVGIGLHQGSILVGRDDIDYSNHTTVMGLPVNIASRLQSKTKDLNNDLLVSEDMFALLNLPGDSYESRYVKLKGITEPVQVRLMGQQYNYRPDNDDMMDYFMAMAG
ncbi:adenylate/guanylate cyclase domain-containing protein [uncultured Mucilaginibacter sp.]|uniref:adenylate/guanylate cyclase domain-containing protein n=1 Tax=uncultured Mucilaginibacter sp. TaxID=797541 RepID=UPI0025F670BC|nr:adenylate/guanylate cyclase domain-containing protein [uncultured Mucilaginibacter sp.]